MLGKAIYDPLYVESRRSGTTGLGLLPMETTFAAEKATYQSGAVIQVGRGWLAGLNGETIKGYEIHMGRTLGANPWLDIRFRNGQGVSIADGAVSGNGRVWGCYIHGLFANRNLRHAWLRNLGWRATQTTDTDLFAASLARLADSLEESLDMRKLERIVWEN